MTDNHGLNTPEKGTADWHLPLNQNFEAIDTGLEIRDTDDRKGSYAPKAGAKFLATDTEQAYLGDGNEWVPVASSGRSASFDAVNNVQVANADRTIQAAHDALPNTGGKVFVDANYAAEGDLPITISKPTIIEGDGWGGLGGGLDFSDNAADTVFRIDQGFDQPRLTCSLKHLHVIGGDTSLVIGNGGMVDLYKCWFEDPATSCLEFAPEGGGLYTRVAHSFFENAGGTGVDMTAPPDGNLPNASSFYGCLFAGHGENGIHAKGVGLNIRDCAIEGNDAAGVLVGTRSVLSSVNVSGCYFEGNAKDESGGPFDADVVLQDAGAQTSTILNTWHSDASFPPTYAVSVYSGNEHYVHMVRGDNSHVYVSQDTTDTHVGWVDPRGSVTIERGARRPRVNGLGRAAGDAEEPDASNWRIGETVEWTDTGDGSGDGLYTLKHDGTWHST